MKINISRQSIYLLSLSVFLLIFVLVFAFAFLIPEGKEYRKKRAELKKESVQLRKYENFRDEVLEQLNELTSKNRHITNAFAKEFEPKRFQKMHRKYFNSLTIAPKKKIEGIESFDIYEVTTTSQINSPTSFYDFLDGVNKSDWIIAINFPIHFQREAEMIRSSFTMKVYTVSANTNTINKEDLNTSK